MSGTKPPNPDDHPPEAPRAEGDPSMEDILASIRRILSEEENAEAAAEAPAEAPVAAEEAEPEEEDVLVLDTSMLVAETPPPVVAPPPPVPEPVTIVEGPVPAPASVADPAPAAPAPALLAPEAAAAAFTAMSDLVRTLAAERSTQVHRGGPTIEDLVREEIRPLLKSWLDANLPPLVERLVRAELERVVNRAVP